MNKLLFSLIVIILGSCCEDRENECPCFREPQLPIYKGCEPGVIYDMAHDCRVMGLYQQFYDAVQYPEAAILDSIEGRVVIAFDIFQDGSIGNYSVVQDTLGYGFADAAIDAIKTFNDRGFCPARENCEPVVYTFTFPVLFVLPK